METNEFKIAQQIAKLQGTVEEGFKGIHARQDITNGRVGRCEIRIGDLEKGDSYSAGTTKGITITWGKIAAFVGVSSAIVGTIVGVIDFLLKHP